MAGVSSRLGWWENTVTTHSDLRSAMLSALARTVDVDEDTGVDPVVSLPRIAGGVGKEITATTAAMAQLNVHTTPRGWELAARPSLESRRTAGHLRELWDLSEELLPGRARRIMVHVLGPWSLGAQLEFRGHTVVADRPAFKDMALTLGEALCEYCERLGHATGAEVILNAHEPDVPRVLAGLEGATQFHALDPVDPEIVAGVWQRFVGQVAVPCVLTGPLLPDATRLTIGAMDQSLQDRVGEMIGAGQGIGVELGEVSARTEQDVEAEASRAATAAMRLWQQWTFPAEQVPEFVDFVVPEAVRTPAQASVAAAVARRAAALLWRN